MSVSSDYLSLIQKSEFVQLFTQITQHYLDFFKNGTPLPKNYPLVESISNLLTENEGKFVYRDSQRSEYGSLAKDYKLLSVQTPEIYYHVIVIWSIMGTNKPLEIILGNEHCLSRETFSPLWCLQYLFGHDKLIITMNSVQTIDWDYEFLVFMSMLNKTTQTFYTAEEKKNLFPWQEGSILVLHEKSSVTATTPHGKLGGSTIVKVDKITDEGVYLQDLDITSTHEHRIKMFVRLDPAIRVHYVDLLDSCPPPRNPVFYSWSNLAFRFHHYLPSETFMRSQGYSYTQYCYYLESHLLVDLPSSPNDVSKTWVYYKGNLAEVEMHETDIIYWVLNQRRYDFDKELFFKENPLICQGRTPLWDECGEVVPQSFIDEIVFSGYTEYVGGSDDEWE